LEVTPYWRTLKTGGVLNEKYPGGVEAQRQRLESEGHIIVQKGKSFTVKDYDRALAKF
jgi:alkylated DNA nucleotide flippase Atl1